jgi:hypothetical protein
VSQPTNMTRLEVVNIETLEVTKAVYLAGHNALEIQQMSDSLLRNVNTFQFCVRAVPSGAPVAVAANKAEVEKIAEEVRNAVHSIIGEGFHIRLAHLDIASIIGKLVTPPATTGASQGD